MAQHNLKTTNPYFTDVWEGRKSFELRKFDRDFKIGDLLVLEEYDTNEANPEQYSGRTITAQIQYILTDFHPLSKDYCILELCNIENYESKY